jgi:putative transposase
MRFEPDSCRGRSPRRWGSLAQPLGVGLGTGPVLSHGPLPWPKNWLDQVNRPLTEKDLDSLRQCVERGQPYGGEAWVKRAAGKLGLASTLRPRGRPKMAEKKDPDAFSPSQISHICTT